MRHYVKVNLLTIFLLMITGQVWVSPVLAAEKPNVVLIFVDDEGWQVLCKACHQEKTNEENKERRNGD